ncbi:hypothetical protein DRQ25_08930 [Candidatus Fermentibacteria bacterium]|nr:MAG: hypothetical protein DRQ25_08930 [Candidatus Fermentibacteria bacterium]
MIIKDLNVGIFKTKMSIGHFFRVKKDALFLELREPTQEETIALSGTEQENAKALIKLMPKCIIEHNVEKEKSVLYNTAELWTSMTKQSGNITALIKEWSDSLPLIKWAESQRVK